MSVPIPPNNRRTEVSNDDIKRQLLAGSFNTPAKRRHLPMAYNLYRQDQLAIKNIIGKSRSKGEIYQRAVEAIKRKWDASHELQTKYDKIRNIIDQEIKNLRSNELQMIRFGEKHPESININDSSWHWQQDQFKFVHPRVRARNSQYQFVKNVKRFGSNKQKQNEKFNEVYSEWKASDHSLKLLAWPTVGGRIVDLFELYRCIVLQGGLGRTLKKGSTWKELGAQMRLSGTGDTLFYQLRIIYYKYLLSFEHKYQVSKDRGGDQNKLKLKKTWIRPKEEDYTYDFEYVEDNNGGLYSPYSDGIAVEKRKKKSSKKRKRYRQRKRAHDMVSIPFSTVHVDEEMAMYSSDDVHREPLHKRRKRMEDESHFKHDGRKRSVCSIETHNVFGKTSFGSAAAHGHFNNYWNGMHFISAIILSLKSRITSNVNWALNRLLFLSFNSKSSISEPFVIKHHAKDVLDALLCLMPHCDVKELDTIHWDTARTAPQQSLLSLQLLSNCFGHEKQMNFDELRAIRNDTNCLLDAGTTRAILRILSNLSLTADNQQCMVDHPVLLPYLLALVKRRDVLSSDCYFHDEKNDYSEIHVDALRVIAHLSEKITLTKWTKKHVESQQNTRYEAKIPFSDQIAFDSDKYRMNSVRFVQRLLEIVSQNLSIACAIDSAAEYKHWMVCYSLMICCHLAANPNNHGVLKQFVKHKTSVIKQEESNHNNGIKCVNLCNVLKVQEIDVSNVMTFANENDEAGDAAEVEWILRIVNHILSPNAQIKLGAVEAAIYLFESNRDFTQYLFDHDAVVKQMIIELVAIGSNAFYGQQLYRSASYALSLLYKQCGQKHQQLFSNCNSRIFEACAQYDDFACYSVHFCQLKRQPQK
eukprot:287520_1